MQEPDLSAFDIAESIAADVLQDMQSRPGFRQQWDQMPREERVALKEAWDAVVFKHLRPLAQMGVLG